METMSDPARCPLPPEPTTYVGRGAEIDAAARLLTRSPLVTLTGPGGVGKTRLALRVADRARAAFPDGAVFVGLAELREPELLVNTVADHLGLGSRSAKPPIELLVEQLAGSRLLLVLDNCEHLVQACAEVVHALLRSCPELAVLATSRQSLGVVGERVLPVGPLPVDGDAVALFTDRATAVVPSFTVDGGNRDDVVRLCRALEGLPLAIELAAVRLRSLSVRQLADRLDGRMTLLSDNRGRLPDRHGTIAALIGWSHELCTDRERLLWARASVFAGTFDLDAAELVCAGPGLAAADVLDVVDSLVDKSVLLRGEHAGTVRYRMLEMLRHHGEERARAAGEHDRLRRAHRDWCLGLTARFAEDWFGPRQPEWVERFRLEQPNLRAALDFCRADPAEAVVGLGMVHAVKELWVAHGLNTEGRIWLDKLSAVAPPDAPVRGSASWMYAFLALVQNDIPAYERALADAARSTDETTLAYVDHVHGYQALIDADFPTATDLFDAAAKSFTTLGDEGGRVWATLNHGLALMLDGHLDEGRRVLRESEAACAAHQEVFWRSWALWSRGAGEYVRGDLTTAADLIRELLRLQAHLTDRVLTAFSLTVLAGCATHLSDPRRAARLMGAASTVWRSVGASPTRYPSFTGPIERDTNLVIAAIGPEAAVAEFTAGAALSTREAVAHALDEHERATPPLAVLTPRETEIAALVAEGLTNRQIAERLVIAIRTADTHVEHILTKLDFNTRAQIAAWFVRSGHPGTRGPGAPPPR
ncbi:putative protein kinase [Actinokineospora spheciospongiae]|uniref:HTH luxR-type domain-containing protein n=2 Tax=Actinokineospora spheciospongiae TaxID=909613 RepID=W7IX36_9PSEU|nr:putative protein kinase [Actinokineospora spheciospongiae]